MMNVAEIHSIEDMRVTALENTALQHTVLYYTLSHLLRLDTVQPDFH
jgi:hypothetical protein